MLAIVALLLPAASPTASLEIDVQKLRSQKGVLRICLHTDVRNDRSRNAMERIGARFEGVLRAHRLAADLIARDSARYSITAEEWPGVKALLADKLRA